MKKIRFCFTLICISILLVRCTNNRTANNQPPIPELVDDTTTYSLINVAIKDLQKTSMPFEIVADRVVIFPPNYPIFSKYDSTEVVNFGHIFSEDDKRFITQQFKHINDFRLNPKYILTKHVIPGDTIASMLNRGHFWNNLKLKYGTYAYSEVSMPLFSKDRLVAFIKAGNHCGGLCGGGGIYVYVKTKAGWKLIKILGEWAS